MATEDYMKHPSHPIEPDPTKSRPGGKNEPGIEQPCMRIESLFQLLRQALHAGSPVDGDHGSGEKYHSRIGAHQVRMKGLHAVFSGYRAEPNNLQCSAVGRRKGCYNYPQRR